MEALPDSCLRAFTMPGNGLSGLDPHGLCPTPLPGRISRNGSLQRQFGFRRIGGGNRLRFWPSVPAAPFFLQQLFDAAFCQAGPGPGSILDLVPAIIVSLSTLTGIPELATEPFGSVIQSTAQELFRGGCRPLLQALSARLLLFDFIDLFSPPRREKGPRLRPFSLCIHVASTSEGFVVINL